MLTGRDDVIDRIVGLEVGADDYIAKPFHLREVLARVRSVLRRHQAPLARGDDETTENFCFDGWQLNVGRRRLLASDGSDVALTTGEFDMLCVLVKHAGRVLTRELLMDLTRSRNMEAYDRTIDAQVARLRKKIERDPKNPTLIQSVRNVGYVFSAKPTQE
jgi:DNA-binding response OmpR family regulator